MITALDTNVLLDVVLPDDDFVEASANLIEASAQLGSLVICDIVYAELCFEFSSRSDCDRFLDANRINVTGMERDACFLASRAWQKYRRQGGPRTRILPDFFVGAHAQMHSSQLITRDSKFYKRHFSNLVILDPTEV